MGGTCARTTAYFYRPTCSAISLPLVEVRLAGTLLQCAEYFAPCIQNMQEKLIDNTTRPGGLELELRAQGIIEQEESSTTVVDPFVTNIEHLGHVCSDFTSLFQSPISSSEGVVNSIVGGISVLADLISTDIDNEAKIGVTIAELLLLRCSQPSVAHNLCERVNDFGKTLTLRHFKSTSTNIF